MPKLTNIERLESRQLLSSTVLFNLLMVNGSSSNDVVNISMGSKIYVKENGITVGYNKSGITQILVNGGEGKDSVFISSTVSLPCVISGGGGNDSIECYGQKGDALDGGSGTDTVSYKNRLDGVTIKLDGIANDGSPGESDNIKNNFEVIVGTAGKDQIDASKGNDVIVYGGEGDDQILASMRGDVYGGPGNEVIYVGPVGGSNDYWGESGKDAVFFINRTVGQQISLDDVANDGLIGEFDNVHTDIEHIVGSTGNDRITGGSKSEILDGWDGNDSITGNQGNDTIRGSKGDDKFYSNLVDGADDYEGATGNDTIDFSGSTKHVSVNIDDVANDGEYVPQQGVSENDNIRSDIETIIGTNDWDQLRSTKGNHKFHGLGGADIFYDDSSKTSDTYYGGAGNDIIYYMAHKKGVNVSLDGAANDGEAGEKDNVSTDVENIVGSLLDDVLTGSSYSNTITGHMGNDTISGMNGDDVFTSTTTSGLWDGADVYIGGSGFDEVTYSSRTEDLNLSLGDGANDGAPGENDDLDSTIDHLFAGKGNDNIVGDDSANSLSGGDGNDTIVGGLGSDTMYGSNGLDTLDYSARTESLIVSLGSFFNQGAAGENDTAGGFETLIGGAGNDTLSGDGNANYIEGGKGNDSISGAEGNDTLRGGDNNDTLDGGAGNDKLYGDGGSDKFRSKDGSKDTLKGGAGTDSVLEKDGNDVLESVP